MGQLSHTKYILYNSPSRVKVTRRHHPLYNQELEVLNADKQVLVVRLADGSPMKMPRSWTDADGAGLTQEPTFLSVFTIESLRELLNLIEALRNRD
jgi:hypothetical protein